MELDSLSELIIGCALEVHHTLGPGLLETAYAQCLAHELQLSGIPFVLQAPIPVEYKGTKLNCGYWADILIRDELIIQLKSVEKILPIHEARLLTYLKLANIGVGLLINFNEKLLKDGVIRLEL